MLFGQVYFLTITTIDQREIWH